MTKRLWTVTFLIVAAVLFVGCKMTKDECSSTYSLMDKDKAACLAAFPDLQQTVSPIPGPKIIVRKVAANLQWSTDAGSGEVIQPGGPSAWTSGEIRTDFAGTITEFTTHDSVSVAYQNCTVVVFQTQHGGDTYTIEIWRTANNKVRWYITKNGTNRKPLLQDTDNSEPTDKVPVEFTGTLVSGSWEEQQLGIDVADINPLRTAN